MQQNTNKYTTVLRLYLRHELTLYLELFLKVNQSQLAKWSKTAIGAGGPGFDSLHGQVKSGTVSPTARHSGNVSSELCCPGAKS